MGPRGSGWTVGSLKDRRGKVAGKTSSSPFRRRRFCGAPLGSRRPSGHGTLASCPSGSAWTLASVPSGSPGQADGLRTLQSRRQAGGAGAQVGCVSPPVLGWASGDRFCATQTGLRHPGPSPVGETLMVSDKARERTGWGPSGRVWSPEPCLISCLWASAASWAGGWCDGSTLACSSVWNREGSERLRPFFLPDACCSSFPLYHPAFIVHSYKNDHILCTLL